MPARCASLISILLLGFAACARADVVEIRWSADARYTYSGVVGAGKFVEVCGKLPAGEAVRWDFKAGRAVDFNLHYHLGKEVVLPSKLSAVTTGHDTLNTNIEQDYCWMWSNRSATPATLSVDLQR